MLQDLRQVQQILPTLKWDTPEFCGIYSIRCWGTIVSHKLHSTWQPMIYGAKNKVNRFGSYLVLIRIRARRVATPWGIDTRDVMLRKMQAMPGWPIYKIKCGTPNDLETIRFLRQHTQATFRVDANCGWKPEQVVEWPPNLSS